MFLLMVSHDCGGSYHEEARTETKVELLPLTKKLDEEILRWVIETEEGEIVEFSGIHKQIVTSLCASMLGDDYNG